MKNLDLKQYQKKRDYLICVDSDGTVIDAMGAKHNHCHGPALIEIWDLQKYAHEVQELWNVINLYSSTRGVNRFIALIIFLEKAQGKYLNVQDLKALKKWVLKNNLSNDSLVEELKANCDPLLKKALDWSNNLNERILILKNEDKPTYEGARAFFEHIKDKADLALISSSNMSALVEEWSGHDLIEYLDVLTSQEVGTKGDCILELIKKGYDPKKILMVGDANPDLNAAKENGTYFYPILTKNELKSWNQLRTVYFDKFLNDDYAQYQNMIIEEFENNLLSNQ